MFFRYLNFIFQMLEIEQGKNFIYFTSVESLFKWQKDSANILTVSNLENFKWKYDTPKTLICHDHQGGYQEYESQFGIKYSPTFDAPAIPFYSFFHWWHIDVFVYFSHHFITVPPAVWIDQAHRHGVLILGTFITESEEIWKEIFSSQNNIEKLIQHLVELCNIFNFDGWLINIENKIDEDKIANLQYFLMKLRQLLRQNVHNCTQVIWYDSITDSGELKWQNELNHSNKKWFDFVDGFYTNYNWKEENIHRTLMTCFKDTKGKSPCDIYIGIDVFGRGCLGGGGWNCAEPLGIIRRYGLSAAIFAPAWICEKFPGLSHEHLFENSFRFWNSLKPHLYPHKLTNRKLQTNFSMGFSSECLNIKDDNDNRNEHRFCMLHSSMQPFYLNSNLMTKDLNPGLIINGGGLHDIFLCEIPIAQLDRGLEIRYTSNRQFEVIITISHMDDVICLQRDAAPGPSQNIDIAEDRRNIQMTRNDREKMPYTERLKQFRQLLKENNITATSNWEDELNNIIFDERYLLLGAAERKQAFETYCHELSSKDGMIKKEDDVTTRQEIFGGCQRKQIWFPLHNKSGWCIQKIALCTPPDTQNLRLYFFEFTLK